MTKLNDREFETLSEFYSILLDFTFRLNLLRSDLTSDDPDEFDEIILMQVVAMLQFASKAKKISRDSFQTKDSPLWYVWQLTPKSYSCNGCQANSASGIAEVIAIEFSEQCRKAWRYPAEVESPYRFLLGDLMRIDSGDWAVVFNEHAESLAPCIVGLAHGLQEWFQSWSEDESFLAGLIMDLNYELAMMRGEHPKFNSEDQGTELSPYNAAVFKHCHNADNSFLAALEKLQAEFPEDARDLKVDALTKQYERICKGKGIKKAGRPRGRRKKQT